MKIDKKYHIPLFAIILAGIVLRILGLDFISGDMKTFLLPWFETFKGMGLREALGTQVGDYNTSYQLLIFLVSRIPGKPVVLIKVISILSDVLLCAGVFFFTRAIKDEKLALAAASVVFLLPTVWLNSSCWGQCDSLYTAFIIWALYALYCKKTIPAYMLLGLALSFKLQTVFIFPFVGYLIIRRIYRMYREKSIDKKEIIFIFAELIYIPLTFLVLWIPNLLSGRTLSDLLQIYLNQTGLYPKMYLNYPSIWAFFPFNYETGHMLAIVVTGITLICLIVWFLKTDSKSKEQHIIWYAFLLSYTCVLILPSMHDRYGFLYEILAVILVLYCRRGYVQLFLLQAISCETYLKYLKGNGYQLWLVSLINLLVYISFIEALKKELSGNYQPLQILKRKETLECREEEAPVRLKKRLIVCITLVFLIMGLVRLGSTKAPQTGITFSSDESSEREVVINYDEWKNVQSIWVYTGEISHGKLNVYNAENGHWVQFGEKDIKTAVFSWIEIPVQAQSYTLAFIIDNAAIREIVITDTDGNTLVPVNSSEYPELFDEQDCFENPPTSQNGMMFDEVYHGRTAYEMLNGLEIYENTHPPLGKILIAIGIAIFGMNPFGWRIVVLLFGTMMVPMVCLLVYRITKKPKFCYLAGVLISTEFMHFTLSRIATIDAIVAFFILGMFYGMICFVQDGKIKALAFAGVMSALGIATKWTALYALAGIGVLWLIWLIGELKKKNILHAIKIAALCVGLFILLPAAVYVLSYIPFARIHPEKNIIEWAIDNSRHMLNYHSGVSASHPYSSKWYSWIVNWTPLLDSYRSLGDGRISTVATFINPIVIVLGTASVFHQIFLVFVRKDETAGMLLILYFSMLIPWMFITRTAFIYQYFVCTMVLIVMICCSMERLCFANENKVICITAAISIAFFVLFYPVISGAPVFDFVLNDILRFMPNWVL